MVSVVKAAGIALMTMLSCAATFAQTPAIQLIAKLDKPKRQLYVGLLNTGKDIYLLRIGSLCGPQGEPNFQFILRRPDLPDQPLVLAYNPPPKAGTPCKKPLPWVVTLPLGVQYGFTLPLSDLHLGNSSGTSLPAFDHAPYELRIGYSGAVSQDFAAKWNHNESPIFPFWAGTTSVTVH